MKRIFAFFLSLLLILGICPMSALADTGGSGNVDGGGGSMGQGTSQNSWNPGMDGSKSYRDLLRNTETGIRFY